MPEDVACLEDTSPERVVADQEVPAAQPGRERLGEGADEDHAPLVVERGDRGERRRAMAELAVVVVLDDDSPGALRPSEQRQARRDGQSAAEGVLVARSQQ